MKILLCTTSLGYGGAETHVLTLAQKLCERGHKVTVASSGGELAQSLPREAEQVKLPPFSRKIHRLAISQIAIDRLIKKGDFDIVHTHARIPSLLCRRPAKKYGVAHITTAHALFKMTPALRRLSVWGDSTIAVSEDIKDLISSSCNLFPDHIKVIPNGIDTERFSPPDIQRKKVKNILFVSRLDSDCSLAARLLCRIAGRLHAEYPEIGITIVGGGNNLDAVRALAEGMNTALGEKVINILGNCADIEKIMRNADIFVGVSRAALEAAACGLPVILAGNEGYGGILSVENTVEDSNKNSLKMTNFCARGLELPTADILFNDLKKLIEMPPSAREKLGTQGRRYVLVNNSLTYTAKETEKVYTEALNLKIASTKNKGGKKIKKRRSSVTLCGYYGFSNSGDDAILDSLIATLRKKFSSKEIKVLTAHPRACRKRFGVNCVSRIDPISLLSALVSSTHLILGGGTLLQNSTSPRSLSYYLWVARLARICRCKIMLVSSGIGPVFGKEARKKTAHLLSSAEFVGLREERAFDTIKSLGADPRRASVFGDAAILTGNSTHSRVDFLMSKHLKTEFDNSFENKNENSKKVNRYMAISLRELKSKKPIFTIRKGSDNEFVSRIASALDGIVNISGVYPIFLILSPEDEKISREVMKKMKNSSSLMPNLTPSETLEFLSRTSLAIGMRLHLLIYALAVGTPAIGLAGDPKITAHLDYSRLPPPFPASLPDPGALVSRALSMLDAEPTIRQTLLTRAAELKALAERESNEMLNIVGRPLTVGKTLN